MIVEFFRFDLAGFLVSPLGVAPAADASAKWKQTDAGLEVNAMRAQRIYNDRAWPNAVVLKITDVKPVEMGVEKK